MYRTTNLSEFPKVSKKMHYTGTFEYLATVIYERVQAREKWGLTSNLT